MRRHLFIVAFAVLSTASITMAETPSSISAKFGGRVQGKCFFSDVHTESTFLQEVDSDGFTIRLSGEGPDERLKFNLRCNGATATVRFEQPKRVNTNGPALAPGTRFNTVFSLDGFSQNFVTTTPDSTTGRSKTFTSKSTTNRLMTVGFGLRSGGDAEIPFLQGDYIFKFTATVTAPL